MSLWTQRAGFRQQYCAVHGHDWGDPIGLPTIIQCRVCPAWEFYQSPAATAAPTSQEGGEIMESITINGVEYTLTPKTAEAAAPRTLTINRPFVVYDVNGDRVDGYKYESRARRNNDARFAGTGYWLGNANTGDFEFVSA